MSSKETFGEDRLETHETPESKSPTESFETSIPPEALSTASEINREGRDLVAEGDKEAKIAETRAHLDGLPWETIEKIRQETHVNEQLAENKREIKELTARTTEKLRALVEFMADPASRNEIDAAFAHAGVKKEPIGSGAFYDTFEQETEPGDRETVLKVLKLNYLFNEKQAAQMMARHSLEADRLRTHFGESFVPNSSFVISEKHQVAFQTELERVSKGNVPLYDLPTFLKIQIDRKLQERYARRDVAEERKGIDIIFGKLGNMLKGSKVFRNESVGVMVEEKVRGMTFHDLMKRGPRGGGIKNWDILKANALTFAERLRTFNEKYAFLWHRFDSDNVVLEVDEQGEPTGEIKILDLNFTERSSELIRKKLAKAMDERMIKPLETYFTE